MKSKHLKTKTIVLYVCLFLSSTLLFAKDDEEDRPTKPGTETVEEECDSFALLESSLKVYSPNQQLKYNDNEKNKSNNIILISMLISNL